MIARKVTPSAYKHHHRFLSTSVKSTLHHDNKSGGEGPSILPLYQRDPDRVTMPRAAFGVSFLNTVYWSWYSLDFIPAVNASPVTDLHIDPTVGYGALGLGIAINVITALYPSLLVSRLDYDETNTVLLLYRYKLPFVTTSSTPTVYQLGDITIDTSDKDLKIILEDYKGDWSRFKGHLALKQKGRALPLLLDVQKGDEEVKNDGEHLLQVLLRPKAFLASRTLLKNNNNHNNKKLKSKGAAMKRKIK
jgi:hypothetical protein